VPIQITLDCPSIGTKQLEWLNEHSWNVVTGKFY
jgi:hypothetical protein